MIPLLIASKQYHEVGFQIEKCLKLPSKGSFNWHQTMYTKAVLCFHNNKIKLAYQTWKEATKAPMKFKDSDYMEERWEVIEMYLHLFAKMGQIEMPGRFRLYKSVNSLIKSSMDKPGQNMGILVVYMLHLLVDGKQAKDSKEKIKAQSLYMKKANTFKAYIKQHLQKPAYARNRYFLHMLLLVDHADYFKMRTSARVGNWWKKLKKTPPTIFPDLYEAEIIPFEKAWEIVLQQLK